MFFPSKPEKAEKAEKHSLIISGHPRYVP
jgi:hypothetical protein